MLDIVRIGIRCDPNCDRGGVDSVCVVERHMPRDDVVAATVRWPKQVELRAKALGLKIPQEFIVSHRSGFSLGRSENAHVPSARGEIVRSFSAALET